jgi:DnaJ-class molecular chaperone
MQRVTCKTCMGTGKVFKPELVVVEMTTSAESDPRIVACADCTGTGKQEPPDFFELFYRRKLENLKKHAGQNKP